MTTIQFSFVFGFALSDESAYLHNRSRHGIHEGNHLRSPDSRVHGFVTCAESKAPPVRPCALRVPPSRRVAFLITKQSSQPEAVISELYTEPATSPDISLPYVLTERQGKTQGHSGLRILTVQGLSAFY